MNLCLQDSLKSDEDVDKLLDGNYAIILELIRLRHRCAGPPPRDCRLLCMFIA